MSAFGAKADIASDKCDRADRMYRSVAATTRRATHFGLPELMRNVQPFSLKYFPLPKSRNSRIHSPSRPHEGRFAIVTIRGAGCDGRVEPQGVRRVAYGQAVWSCPPDAGVKFASEYLAGDGGNKARFTGEITE